MSARLEQIDNAVYAMLGDEPVALLDIVRNGSRLGTIRNALARLLRAKRVKRRWDGNERYGRYVYVQADNPKYTWFSFD